MRLLECLVPVVVLLLIRDSSARPGLLGNLAAGGIGLLDQGFGLLKSKADSYATSNAQSLGGGLQLGPLSFAGGLSSASVQSSASANAVGSGSASASAKADAQAHGGYGGYGGANANAQASANANAQGSTGYYPGGPHHGNGMYNGYRPGYGSYGGSQSGANANANANANAAGNVQVIPIDSSYYPQPYPHRAQGAGNANANAQANANAAANGNAIPVRYPGATYPGRGTGQIEVIPITIQQSKPMPPVYQRPQIQPIPQGPGDVIIVVEEPAKTSPHRYHHRRPHYYGKPKQEPVGIVVIEEPSGPGDTSRSIQPRLLSLVYRVHERIGF